ncbi:zinc ribbon domain-containing protein [bacterium]|nr:zinc ribbon domain-containing protein [bacterium]
MPIYEFRCQQCEAVFQELFSTSHISITDVECPHCHAKKAEKLLSVFAAETKSGNALPVMSGGGCGPSCGCHH